MIIHVKTEDYQREISRLLPELVRVIKPTGNICWQVGSHILNGVMTPLDAITYGVMAHDNNWQLRNRVVWDIWPRKHIRHIASVVDMRLCFWFSRSREYYFDLESVRVPQKISR